MSFGVLAVSALKWECQLHFIPQKSILVPKKLPSAPLHAVGGLYSCLPVPKLPSRHSHACVLVFAVVFISKCCFLGVFCGVFR